MDHEIIGAAKKRFDSQLHTPEYKRIHSDDEHLNRLIDLFDIKPGKNYLDLGTGNGYVAFQLAKRFPDILVHGLDIATNSIEQNNEIKKREKISNIDFRSYNGVSFPYAPESFYGSISRYAFHHFPNPDKSISEIRKVVQPHGFFVFSDPLTYDEDAENFVDKFQMQMTDGHVHFYRKSEIETYFRDFHFQIEKEFESTIRYPRSMNKNYEALFKGTPKNILDKYKIEIEADTVYITVSVMNILFRKSES